MFLLKFDAKCSFPTMRISYYEIFVRGHLSRFGGRRIGRGSPVARPQRLPDLSPLYFYLWRVMKPIFCETPEYSEMDLVTVACSQPHIKLKVLDGLSIYTSVTTGYGSRQLSRVKQLDYNLIFVTRIFWIFDVLPDMDYIGTERIPLLNQTNWCTWKENMRFLLMDRGCWSFIDGPKLEETTTRRERLEYKQRKDRAFSTIYYGVDNQHNTLLSILKDADEARKLLQEQFEPKSRASVIRLLGEFFK
ncbi:hypothetical protein CEXT_198731 [Caerostris extrusa]|uniref:Uncharacterized protein n=1 Tax=Caerostris extrusa TaxID=172846 RepID=A0AAV4TYA2_CAEEX|nr:hypothetical protein CEXT_198731 [Caerostris extrusa]